MASVYTSPGYAALLAGVRAEPEDDLPRLTLADWLDDRGKPARAELIRRHVRFARTGAGDRKRLNALLNSFRPGPLRRMCAKYSGGYGWDRGFVTSVHCPASMWVQHGDELLSREPVREVRLSSWVVVDLDTFGPSIRPGDRIGPGMLWPKWEPGEPSFRFALRCRWPDIAFTVPFGFIDDPVTPLLRAARAGTQPATPTR